MTMTTTLRHTFVQAAVLAALLAPHALAAAPAAADAALATRLHNEEIRLRGQRHAYGDYFRRAYARYPSIPAGTLEAIAYVQTRWNHLQPAAAGPDPHQHMPRAWGLMGLYHGGGFADQVTQAARLLGVPAARVMRDPQTNVLAAAALLDREIAASAAAVPALAQARAAGQRVQAEDARPALARYAGFAPRPTRVQDHARDSFAYDVLLAMDKGVNDRGIAVPSRAIAWERAFTPKQLVAQQAPFVRLDVRTDRVEAGGYAIDPTTETLKPLAAPQRSATSGAATDVSILSTDYAPALWVASPYYHARSSYDSVTIHTTQGSYAGSISWFQNNPYSVSAHYLVRSSDGQITQMVRNSNAAHHVGVHNNTTLGIEHEGYIDNSSWYTSAMYNASSALVRDFCSRYTAISCANAYNGPGTSGILVLSTAIDVKGHQHYSSQTHTDPGPNWDWRRYYTLLNPGSGGTTRVLDSFESTVGHFDTAPAYSGSTTGIAATSQALRDCGTRKVGSCSLRVLLQDNTASSVNWDVRLLSGSGNPGSNSALSRSNGRVGFWVYAGGSGMSVAVGVDDSDGTERSVARALAANTWTFVEWSLTDAAQWNAWVGNANGAITAASVTLDAIWLSRAQTSYDVNVYIDDVQIHN